MKYLQTFRLHPTPEQAAIIRQRFALAGYAYNWGIKETERVWESEHRHLSLYDVKDLYRHHVNYQLHRVCGREEMEALVHLDHAYDEYYARRANLPKTKQAEDMVSYTILASAAVPDYEHQTMRLPFVGSVPCRLYRHIQGSPTTATIKECKTGEFNIILLTEADEYRPAEQKPEVVGIDLGISTFATLSNGLKYKFPENIWNRPACRRDAHLQRLVQRCKEGSRRREKAKQRLAKYREHKANQRKDFHCKLAVELCNDYPAISVESLDIEDMKQNKYPFRRSMNRNLQNYGLAQFLHRLEARCLRTGTQFLKIDRWAPSTKRCHNCGFVIPILPLEERTWYCPKCDAFHDRDINAAINIKLLGQQLQTQTPTHATGGVKTVERTERPRIEPVEEEFIAPAPAPQEAAEPGISRLAVTEDEVAEPQPQPATPKEEKVNVGITRLSHKEIKKRTLSPSDFLKNVSDVITPDKVSKILGVPCHQVKEMRTAMTLDWRIEMMTEKCEALRLKLIRELTDRLPSVAGASPKEFVREFKKKLKGWLCFNKIISTDPRLTQEICPENSMQWYLYMKDIIANLQQTQIKKVTTSVELPTATKVAIIAHIQNMVPVENLAVRGNVREIVANVGFVYNLWLSNPDINSHKFFYDLAKTKTTRDGQPIHRANAANLATQHDAMLHYAIEHVDLDKRAERQEMIRKMK